MWTEVFLDEYDTSACLVQENAVSKRARVFEVDASEYEYSGRASWHDSDQMFYLCDEIHEWLLERKPNYTKEVILVGSLRGRADALQPGFILAFADRGLAMMFKLAWGGE